MQRSDRGITDPKRLKEVIESCFCCRLGFFDGEGVYIVPLCFGYEETETERIFYFHSAKEGRKGKWLHTGTKVGFELDTGHYLKEGANACSYSAGYQSVIGTGRITVIEDEEKKKDALAKILSHYGVFAPLPGKLSAKLLIYQMTVETLSGKENK